MLKQIGLVAFLSGIALSTSCAVDTLGYSFASGGSGAGEGGANGSSGASSGTGSSGGAFGNSGGRAGDAGDSGFSGATGALGGRSGGGASSSGGNGDAGASEGGTGTGGDTSEGGSAGETSGSGGASPDGGRGGGSSEGGATGTNGGSVGKGGSAGTSGGAAGKGGSGGTSGGSASKGGSTSSGGAPSMCSANQACAPTVPSGWNGPTITSNNATLPACPTSYPTAVFEAGNVSQGTATCSCSCTQPTNVFCSPGIIVRRYSGANCTGTFTESNEGSECIGAGFSTSTSVQRLVPQHTCGAGATTANITAPSISARMRGCAGTANLGSCNSGSGICVATPPSPFASRLCVSRTGDNACPSGYPSKTVLYGGVSDSRACPSSCSCTRQDGVCSATLQSYVQGSSNVGWCATTSAERVITSEEETCIMTFMGSPTGLTVIDQSAFPSESPACNPVDPAPTGAAAGTSPVTVCCTQ